MKNIKTYEEKSQQTCDLYSKKYESYDELIEDLSNLDNSNIDYNIYYNLRNIAIVYAFIYNNSKNRYDINQRDILWGMEYLYSDFTNKMYLGLKIDEIDEIEKELLNKYDKFDNVSSKNIQNLEAFKMRIRSRKFNI